MDELPQGNGGAGPLRSWSLARTALRAAGARPEGRGRGAQTGPAACGGPQVSLLPCPCTWGSRTLIQSEQDMDPRGDQHSGNGSKVTSVEVKAPVSPPPFTGCLSWSLFLLYPLPCTTTLNPRGGPQSNEDARMLEADSQRL